MAISQAVNIAIDAMKIGNDNLCINFIFSKIKSRINDFKKSHPQNEHAKLLNLRHICKNMSGKMRFYVFVG
jgi:hypothetical protein